MKLKRKLIIPGPNKKCLCGSNNKFKKCCAVRRPKTTDLGKAFSRYCNEEDYRSALIAARADITQYTILHRNHTTICPFDETPNPLARLWKIDIEALFHYVDRLRRVYNMLNREEEVPAVLERLRDNIDAPPWRSKIIFLHTLCALGKSWDIDAGYREISKLGTIDDVDDPVLLAMYLNLARDRLSLSQRLKLIDRVRETSEEASDTIHQGVVKATLLMVHDDARGAAQTLEEVIDYCKSLDELDEYQRLKFGHAYFIIGAILTDTKKNEAQAEAYLEEAIAQFLKYMETEWLTDAHKADAHRDLADAYRIKGDVEKALSHYDRATALTGAAILQVFRAVCLDGLDRQSEALATIDAVNVDDFEDEAEKSDYVLHFAMLAVAHDDRERLLKAKELLALPINREPIFANQALRMTKVVLETIATGKSSFLMRSARGILRGMSSSLILQPNFMGVGININKLIDEGVAKHSEPDNDEQ